jgi:hypothetical protein
MDASKVRLPEGSVLERRGVQQGPGPVGELGYGARVGMGSEAAMQVAHGRQRPA